MPTLSVYYFAALRERKGCDMETVEAEAGETVHQLYLRLFSDSTQERIPVGYAVNQIFGAATHELQDGDEVAFIPPIGGG